MVNSKYMGSACVSVEDHNMLTLDTPYGFHMCFLMVNVVSETTRSSSARGDFRGDVETRRFDCGQWQSLQAKAEWLCFVTPAVAIVWLLQSSFYVEYSDEHLILDMKQEMKTMDEIRWTGQYLWRLWKEQRDIREGETSLKEKLRMRKRSRLKEKVGKWGSPQRLWGLGLCHDGVWFGKRGDVWKRTLCLDVWLSFAVSLYLIQIF